MREKERDGERAKDVRGIRESRVHFATAIIEKKEKMKKRESKKNLFSFGVQ